MEAGAELVLGLDFGGREELMGQDDDRVLEEAEFFLTASSFGQPTTYKLIFLYVIGSLMSRASTSSTPAMSWPDLARESSPFGLVPACSQRGALTPDTRMPGRLGPSPTRRGRPSDSERHDFGTDLWGRLLNSSLNGHFLWHSLLVFTAW